MSLSCPWGSWWFWRAWVETVGGGGWTVCLCQWPHCPASSTEGTGRPGPNAPHHRPVCPAPPTVTTGRAGPGTHDCVSSGRGCGQLVRIQAAPGGDITLKTGDRTGQEARVGIVLQHPAMAEMHDIIHLNQPAQSYANGGGRISPVDIGDPHNLRGQVREGPTLSK